jgi:hypothetical protein
MVRGESKRNSDLPAAEHNCKIEGHLSPVLRLTLSRLGDALESDATMTKVRPTISLARHLTRLLTCIGV